MDVQVQVEKEMHELMQALHGIVKATKQALADGFQPGMDIPQVVMAAVGVLPAAIQGLDSLPANAKANPVAFMNAAGLGASAIAGEFIKAQA